MFSLKSTKNFSASKCFVQRLYSVKTAWCNYGLAGRMQPAEGICAARGTILHKSCQSQAAVIFFGERYDFARK